MHEMKRWSLGCLAVLTVFTAGCATTGGQGKGDGSWVTFKPGPGWKKHQRTEVTKLDVKMQVDANGIRGEMPMVIVDRTVVDVENVSDTHVRIFFREKTSETTFGEERSRESAPVHQRTYVFERGAQNVVRTEAGEVVEGEEATAVSDAADDDNSAFGREQAEFSVQMRTDLPMLNKVVMDELGGGTDGTFKEAAVSIQLVEDRGDEGVFSIDLKGTLTMPEGSMDMALTGDLRVRKVGMDMLHMALQGPVTMNLKTVEDGQEYDVKAHGTMTFQMANTPL